MSKRYGRNQKRHHREQLAAAKSDHQLSITRISELEEDVRKQGAAIAWLRVGPWEPARPTDTSLDSMVMALLDYSIMESIDGRRGPRKIATITADLDGSQLSTVMNIGWEASKCGRLMKPRIPIVAWKGGVWYLREARLLGSGYDDHLYDRGTATITLEALPSRHEERYESYLFDDEKGITVARDAVAGRRYYPVDRRPVCRVRSRL